MSKYTYLNQGGPTVNLMSDDKQNFRIVNEAMKTANFEPSLIKTIWSIVAAIIHLGSVNYESSEKDVNNNSSAAKGNLNEQAKLSSDSLNEIKLISKLLKLDENELINSLTSRVIASGSREVVTKYHSVKDALYAKDALAKVCLF